MDITVCSSCYFPKFFFCLCWEMRRAPNAIHYSARTNSLDENTLILSHFVAFIHYFLLILYLPVWVCRFVWVSVCACECVLMKFFGFALLCCCFAVFMFFCLSGWYCHLAAAQRAPLLAWLTPPFARVLTIIICCCASRSLVHDFVVCAEVGCAVLLRLCCSR